MDMNASLRSSHGTKGGSSRAALPWIVFGLLLFAGSSNAQDGWKLCEKTSGLNYKAVDCADSMDCIAVAASHGTAMIRWTKGGDVWRSLDTLHRMRPFAVAHPTSALTIVALDSGLTYRSSDMGRTWKESRIATRNALQYLDMLDSTRGMVASSLDLWKTVDGGLTWQHVPSPAGPTAWIGKVVMADADTYLLLIRESYSCRVVRTTDGGSTWSSGQTIDSIADVDFVDPDYGWAVGFNFLNDSTHYAKDVIYSTTDGGATWHEQLNAPMGEPFGLLAVDFWDRLNGLAVGPQGKILRTANGGRTWKLEHPGLSSDNWLQFTDVTFGSATFAYAVTTSGHFLRKGDGTTNAWSDVDDGRQHEAPRFHVRSNVVSYGQDIELRLSAARPGVVRARLIDMTGSLRWSAVLVRSEATAVFIPGVDLARGCYLLSLDDREINTVVKLQVR